MEKMLTSGFPRLNDEIEQPLRTFVRESHFTECGGVVTDLDGTAVHEFAGRAVIPEIVEHGLKRLLEVGRPVMINSLRFPLSIIRTFGRAWYAIANSPIPTVSLNGSLLGYVVETKEGMLSFDEIAAFPLTSAEIDDALSRVADLLRGGLTDITLFYYPRDWTAGEHIWTPIVGKIARLQERYPSASAVQSGTLGDLQDRLLAQDVCMIFLLVEAAEDRLMAYQHTGRSNFITRPGVDKLFGARVLAEKLRVALEDSVGAGDTDMDRFLAGVGLAIHVGSGSLEFRGRLQTIRLKDSNELGALFFRLADLHQDRAS